MGKFEDRLLGDLLRDHSEDLRSTLPVRSRNTRPMWIAAGAVALAGAVTVGLTLVDGGAPAAFAVDRNDDGSITVKIEDVAAIDPANKELERLGVPIRAVPLRPDCPVPSGSGDGAAAGGGNQPGEPLPDDRPSGNPSPGVMINAQLGGDITIPRSVLTPGANVALGVDTAPDGTVRSMSFATIEGGPMPVCLPSGPPPGERAEPTPTN
jgi:hypothetical protein